MGRTEWEGEEQDGDWEGEGEIKARKGVAWAAAMQLIFPSQPLSAFLSPLRLVPAKLLPQTQTNVLLPGADIQDFSPCLGRCSFI